jgi:hypothetical protein
MIVEIVTFDLPPGTGRAEAMALYRQSAGKWLMNSDLVGKYYFLDEGRSVGGGVYLWHSRADAAHWHGEAYRNMVATLYGSAPRIEIFDAMIRVDPVAGVIAEL